MLRPRFSTVQVLGFVAWCLLLLAWGFITGAITETSVTSKDFSGSSVDRVRCLGQVSIALFVVLFVVGSVRNVVF